MDTIIRGDKISAQRKVVDAVQKQLQALDDGVEVSIAVSISVLSKENLQHVLGTIAHGMGAKDETQVEMARVFGVSQGTISKIINGISVPVSFYRRISQSNVITWVPSGFLGRLKLYVLGEGEIEW